MATATVTLATFANPPRAMPNGGITSQAFKITTGVATSVGTAGDQIWLCKIPNGARILDCQLTMDVTADSWSTRVILARVESVGTSGTLGSLSVMSEVLQTLSGSVTLAHTGVPFYPICSLSDDAAVQFAVLALEFSGGTQTKSMILDGRVVYETFGTSS